MSAATALKDRIRADLKQAMKDGRKTEAGLLRTILAAIDNAEAPAQTAEQAKAVSHAAAEVERLDLSQEQLNAVLAEEIDARMKAADEMDRLGQTERAEMLRTEAGWAWRYL